MVSPDSQATACLPSGRNSTYRPVQISETSSDQDSPAKYKLTSKAQQLLAERGVGLSGG
jgi:hypothetical protein